MKTYRNIFRTASLLAMLSLGMTSCNDWLTVHPQTQIVEENFWEDKRDLEGVRYAVYKSMADQVEKMIIWGDLRSDSYIVTEEPNDKRGNRENFTKIVRAEIDTTWSYYDWSGMYSTIGYCNKVLQHGEEILAKDKQFTASEWRQMKAEMVTMRAMCYFYLVRAFKYIPYTTKVVNTDSEIECFPQLPVLDVMDSLITDVESVAGQARNRFVNKDESKGMITNTAIYALLSDMYLWRASIYHGRGDIQKATEDYQACILNSEYSISKLKDQFDEERKGAGISSLDGYISWEGAPSFNGKQIDFMYKNNFEESNRGYFDLKAYDEIFFKGNSYESIFELQFNSKDSRKNNAVNSMWGASDYTHLYSTLEASNGAKRDTRYWFSSWKLLAGDNNLGGKNNFCCKWSFQRAAIPNDIGVGTASAEIEITQKTEEYNNWIVYRLSDVLLQNAEARAILSDSLKVNKDENAEICRHILRMVNRRWLVNMDKSTPTSEITDLKTNNESDIDQEEDLKKDLLGAVLKTRQIEFLSEGKRWFDLVRYAERISDSDESETGLYKVYEKFAFTNKVASKCVNLWGMYSPIYYMECKAYRAKGATLVQNPVWNKSKYDR